MTGRRAQIAVPLLLAVLTLAGFGGIGSAQAEPSDPAGRLQAALEDLVAHPNGPPGALVLVQRGSAREIFRAGEANTETGAPMEPDKHMRIASTAKAYSGGVALSLVQQGVLSLRDTIGERLPWAPPDWRRVTLRQVLHHTSGMPDFTENLRFQRNAGNHLDDPLRPRRLLSFVAHQDLAFEPGSRYKYSNSDNVVVGLMVEDATGRRYERVLAEQVLDPLGLDNTSLPRGVQMPRPLIHGYQRENDGTLVDVSELIAAGWAWASGGIVSTP
ncbi:MAG: serine hydrolase domain-containing protein, partial [Nocardioidaceae bacterium]